MYAAFVAKELNMERGKENISYSQEEMKKILAITGKKSDYESNTLFAKRFNEVARELGIYKEKTKKDYFSYHEDWAGYNIPCTSIESCIAKIPDLNFYDLIMFSVVDTIKNIIGGDNYYLIGIDQSDGEDPSLIFHEVDHGLWFSSSIYKRKQFNNIERMNPSVRNTVAKKITGMGYGENVVDDEIQSYLSTGIGDSMTRIKDIKQAQLPFKAVFDSYAGKIKPKKINIDWSTDLDN